MINERIKLDGAPGRYRCAASLGTAAAPAAGRQDVVVIAPPEPLVPGQRAAAFGLDETEQGWFAARGVDWVSGPRLHPDVKLLVVGHTSQLSDEEWRTVADAVHSGATAIVLTPWEAIPPGETTATLPFSTSIACTRFHDWLYHKECFARDARFVSGLQPPGLMKWRRLRPDPCLATYCTVTQRTSPPSRSRLAIPRPGGYLSGLIAASFRDGSGRVVMSTFDLLTNLGSLAAADQLALNLLRYALR